MRLYWFVFVSAETMFKNGTLLASYQGVSATWQAITIEYPPSGPQPEGRYVLLQQNKNQILEVRKFGASFEGKAQNFITTIGKCDKCPTLTIYEYAQIIYMYITLLQLQKTLERSWKWASWSWLQPSFASFSKCN